MHTHNSSPPEAIPPNRFTSSSPLTSSSVGSPSSSGPRIGVSGDAGPGEKFPTAAIKSARRCLGPVSGIGFSRKVADTVRQRRGSSKNIRTKATMEFECVENGNVCRCRRTNVHHEFEDRNPGFLLSRPQELECFIGVISPDTCHQECTLGLDIFAIGLSGRRDGMWCGRWENRTMPARRTEERSCS